MGILQPEQDENDREEMCAGESAGATIQKATWLIKKYWEISFLMSRTDSNLPSYITLLLLSKLQGASAKADVVKRVHKVVIILFGRASIS